MKILALNFNLKGVGTFRRSFYFSRELARAGHQVTLATVSPTSRYRTRAYFKRSWIGEAPEPRGDGPWIRIIEGAGLGYQWLPGWGSGPLDIWARFREILHGNYDAVYGFEYHPNVSWPVYLTRHFKRYRFYSDWCDWFAGASNHLRGWRPAQCVDRFLEERIRFCADRVSVTSTVLRDRAVAIGIPHDRVIKIPEGAATDYIRPLPRAEMRRRFGIPQDAPVLLAVRNGGMSRELKIFRWVLAELPGALLLLIGRLPASALLLARELGIDKSVMAPGWTSDEDYPRYLACADICFCPLDDSLNDRARWPAKVLDFLASGRATVTNAVGEVEPLLRRNQVGLAAGQGEEEFAAVLAALLKDPERRSYLGANARELMVKEWDWSVRGKLINEVVSG
jgi:glycosyltransferase involved in cell wall biosynthesis